MKFIILRKDGFKCEYWKGAALDIWSTEIKDAKQFSTFDDAYETMKEAAAVFVNMLVEQFHQHVETSFGPLHRMYKATPTAILVSVPSVRGIVENKTLFDLEILVPDVNLPDYMLFDGGDFHKKEGE